MNTVWIESFLTYVREGNYQKAAVALNYTPQTVLKNVQALEEYLDVLLIDRKKDGTLLTPAGKYYESIFRAAWKELDTMPEDVRSTISQSFRVGFSEYLSPFGPLGGALKDFREEYPQIRMSCEFDNNKALSRKLLEKKLDVVLYSSAHVPPEHALHSIPVVKEKLYLYGPAEMVGKDLPIEKRRNRVSLPYLVCDSGRTTFETDVFCRLELSGLEYAPTTVKVVPNIASMRAEMCFKKGLAVSDSILGFLNDISELGHEELESDSYVCACQVFDNYVPAVSCFVEYMQDVLGYRNEIV